jgi:2'-5' RNA ligase
MGDGTKVDTIRAFVALDLDAMSMRRAIRVAERLRMASGAPSATWTPQSKVHITLKFLGGLPAAAAAPLGEALAALVDPKKTPCPGTCLLQAFPSIEMAEVVVVELTDPRGELAKLAAKVDELAARHGIEPESRAFRPHVTLARLKRPYDTRRWLKAELAGAAGELTAARLTLYRSDLGTGKDGASVYTPLATYPYDVPG